MSCHSGLRELIPFYVARTLGDRDRGAVETHLANCAECQADLALWSGVEETIVAEDRGLSPGPSAAVLHSALARARQGEQGPLQRAWQLLRAQAPLVRREIWPACALVMGLGFVVAVVGAGDARATSVVVALAPLVAAASVAMIYGQENDPALELALATPTSPRQVLLARLVLVFGYDLLLALAATVGLVAVVPPAFLGTIILSWLGPMTFLSALALTLSIRIGTGSAVTVAFLLWLGRWLARGIVDARVVSTAAAASPLASGYEALWASPAILLSLAVLLVAAALWMAGRQESLLPRS